VNSQKARWRYVSLAAEFILPLGFFCFFSSSSLWAGNFSQVYGSMAQEHPVGDIEGVAPQVKLPLKLILNEKVLINADRIRLGDLAVCEGLQEICNEAVLIDLAAAPLPGRVATLGNRQIADIISRELPGISAEILGPEQIRVEADAIIVEKEIVQQSLEDLLKEAEESGAIKFKVVSLNMPGSFKVRRGPFHVEFPEVRLALQDGFGEMVHNPAGIHRLEAVYVSDDNAPTRIPLPITVRLDVYIKTPVLRHPKATGESLRDEDFVIEWVKKTNMSERWVTDVAQATGKVTRRSLSKGSVVGIDALATPVLVKRGQRVKVTFMRDGIQMSGVAKALGPGAAGEWIEVVYQATGKKLGGRIKEDSTVEIAL